jgi:hypothetical protein
MKYRAQVLKVSTLLKISKFGLLWEAQTASVTEEEKGRGDWNSKFRPVKRHQCNIVDFWAP